MYKQFASGYLVNDGKVLLVHNNKFDKWVPPGGHMEENETPEDTVIREFREETGLKVEVVPAYPSAFHGDKNTTLISMPFHLDLEREGFDVPHIGLFFYVKTTDDLNSIAHQEKELSNYGWFGLEDLEKLETFDQVRALAKYAITHYPK